MLLSVRYLSCSCQNQWVSINVQKTFIVTEEVGTLMLMLMLPPDEQEEQKQGVQSFKNDWEEPHCRTTMLDKNNTCNHGNCTQKQHQWSQNVQKTEKLKMRRNKTTEFLRMMLMFFFFFVRHHEQKSKISSTTTNNIFVKILEVDLHQVPKWPPLCALIMFCWRWKLTVSV